MGINAFHLEICVSPKQTLYMGIDNMYTYNMYTWKSGRKCVFYFKGFDHFLCEKTLEASNRSFWMNFLRSSIVPFHCCFIEVFLWMHDYIRSIFASFNWKSTNFLFIPIYNLEDKFTFYYTTLFQKICLVDTALSFIFLVYQSQWFQF